MSGSLVPIAVPGLAGVTAISAGTSDGYAVKSDGTVRSWGSNEFGQLGIGTIDSITRSAPVVVSGLSGITGIAASGDATFAFAPGG